MGLLFGAKAINELCLGNIAATLQINANGVV